MFTATNTTPTTAAQKPGFRCHGHGPSSGRVVRPITRFFNSASGLGLVTRLTSTVTLTHTTNDHQALYILMAIGLAFSERAISFACCALNAAGANFLTTVVVWTSTPGWSTSG